MSNCIDTIYEKPEPSLPRLTWKAWVGMGTSKLRNDLCHLCDLLFEWHRRRTERRALARLSDRGLKDLGLSRADAWKETRKPFWRD